MILSIECKGTCAWSFAVYCLVLPLRMKPSLPLWFFSLASLVMLAPALHAQQPAPSQIQARKMLYNNGQHTLSAWESYPVRTVDALTPRPRAIPVDRYGGRADRDVPQTGFFYTAKIANRWWFVDPDGHPYLNNAVDAVAPGKSPRSEAALQLTFGTHQDWMDQTERLLLQDSFNGVGAWSDVDLLRASALQAVRPLAYTINLDIMSSYGATRGGTHQAAGHKAYPQDTVFIFDPDFRTFALHYVATHVAAYRNDPNLLGYFSDNEIPLLRSNLDGFLSLPASDPGHRAAVQWMHQHHAKKPTDVLRAEFLQFEAERYFGIVAAAIHHADPNHLYLGCRFYGQQLHDPELFRAIGPFVGAVSINVYGIWQPQPDLTSMWLSQSGKPFLVTEFYAKAEDSGMPNRTGSGWLVHTQNDRGLFYQTFTLALLQSRSCVGWQWFKYQDNDPEDTHADPSNVDSNKGIVNRFYQPYTPLLERMEELNRHMYGAVDALDSGIGAAVGK